MTDSFGARKTLAVRSSSYQIYRLDAVKGATETLPYTLKILLENLLRFEDGENITAADITALANWDPKAEPDREISFTPDEHNGYPDRQVVMVEANSLKEGAFNLAPGYGAS